MWYFVKRLLSGFLTIVLISIVVFFMFQVVPGNPVLSRLGSEEIDQNPELAQRMYESFHLDKPAYERYFIWVKGMLHGDMGESFKYGGQSVNKLIHDRMGETLFLALCSMVLIVAVALPLGFYLAPRQDRRSGVLFNALSQIGLAMPTFWVAIILIYIFSMKLKILPTRAMISFEHPGKTLRSMIMPIITLSLGNISLVIRYMVSALNESAAKPFTKVAKARSTTVR